MKGINNRQKTIVKPRESFQKYVSQQQNLRKNLNTEQHRFITKSLGRKHK